MHTGADPGALILTRPDDWHLHLRDGGALRDTVRDSARTFGRAIVMPNLRPPVRTTAEALAYRERILAARPPGSGFTPLMTLYLTDVTEPAEIRRAVATGVINAVKLYPAGATTNSDAGVTDVARVDAVLEAMAAANMPLLVHAEVTDRDVDIFDRERVFIDRVLRPLVARHPTLKVVLEHATTEEAVAFVRESELAADGAAGRRAATITAHHLLLDRSALFDGGLRPHHYCLPVLKRAHHREALVAAATRGDPRFFLGTDSAPHARDHKEAACGCAGCYTAHAALELYAEAFEAAGALDRLEGFASLHGPAFYGLAPNPDTVHLVRRPQAVPETVPHGDARVVPLRAGGVVAWSLAP